ncbi:MAG: hypothetical protein GY874_04180 [Desulfobacteraceae bacterium]|nr:hypothetical protein [Desulfobacteraceae bacterium]
MIIVYYKAPERAADRIGFQAPATAAVFLEIVWEIENLAFAADLIILKQALT